jgi:CO/xanthine dehydrogenase Mo-binding subunit
MARITLRVNGRAQTVDVDPSTPLLYVEIDVVLVNGDPNPNRPDLPHYGAGETVCKPLIAAVANAIHDATGVRLRRVPFRNARVLKAAKV